MPIYGGRIQGELCTPTGAALLKHFTAAFGDMPVMRVQRVGYGMGKKDFEAANCVRAMLGETGDGADSVYELNCNIDDMTAETIGFAAEKIREAGAVEVFTTAVMMKKNRPGTLLTVLWRPPSARCAAGCLPVTACSARSLSTMTWRRSPRKTG